MGEIAEALMLLAGACRRAGMEKLPTIVLAHGDFRTLKALADPGRDLTYGFNLPFINSGKVELAGVPIHDARIYDHEAP